MRDLREWAIAQWNRFNPAYSEPEVPEWLETMRMTQPARAECNEPKYKDVVAMMEKLNALECSDCPIESECVDALEHPCDKLMDDLEVRAQELYEEESKQVLTMWLEGKI